MSNFSETFTFFNQVEFQTLDDADEVDLDAAYGLEEGEILPDSQLDKVYPDKERFGDNKAIYLLQLGRAIGDRDVVELFRLQEESRGDVLQRTNDSKFVKLIRLLTESAISEMPNMFLSEFPDRFAHEMPMILSAGI